MSFGLVGKKLSHSYSVVLHEKLGDQPYSLISLQEEEFSVFMQKKAFRGINVTIPYKVRAMAYCEKVDATAKAIGAVNTVVNRGGKLWGYNTDAAGLRYLLQGFQEDFSKEVVLVLGSGGTSRTAVYVLGQLGAKEVLVVSRQPAAGQMGYEEALLRWDVTVVVNTTPLGMYPNNGKTALSIAAFPQLKAVVDVVYNPFRTALLLEAENKGIRAVGGLGMLVEQARVSSELFLGKERPAEITRELTQDIYEDLANVVLIGMPGCGKSSLGRSLAEQLGKEFVDVDEVIASKTGRSPMEIIQADGEAAFREIETACVQDVGRENHRVIATGGGSILRGENVDALRQNGILIFIDCPAHELPLAKGRPLSQSREDLVRLEKERRGKYESAADGSILYDRDFGKNVENLRKKAGELLKAGR